ncbi:jg26244 [Pararge aegeria aegeria]|uniref:Jg26244 protein n=1 Tax=Pararge aegeria aegeria TaxID=348720 RepID=A0A8S4R930_9NEOP|nr:jg26244 [Pararge aegeria aegeria]
MNNSIVAPIENLRIWSGGNWIKCNGMSNLLLRIHYDQLLVTSEDKVLESLNTNKKLKGIFKDDILILIINAEGQELS